MCDIGGMKQAVISVAQRSFAVQALDNLVLELLFDEAARVDEPPRALRERDRGCLAGFALPRLFFRATRDIAALEPLSCSDVGLCSGPRSQRAAAAAPDA